MFINFKILIYWQQIQIALSDLKIMILFQNHIFLLIKNIIFAEYLKKTIKFTSFNYKYLRLFIEFFSIIFLTFLTFFLQKSLLKFNHGFLNSEYELARLTSSTTVI